MNASEMERFHRLFEELLQALKLHGLRPKTIDSYCRSIRRVANHFGRTPDDLKPDELKSYFSALTVAARKDDAPAAHHAALTKIAGWGSCSDGGGLIHTTSG